MQEYNIARMGFAPLRFVGELIGKGTTQDQTSTRWTEVTLYRAVGGKYVAGIDHRTQSQGESMSTDAQAFATPRGAIDFLKREGGKLGKPSQQAVEAAAKVDPQFAAAWGETVE